MRRESALHKNVIPLIQDDSFEWGLSDRFSSMPTNPRERADWCKENFWSIIVSHIQYLKLFKILDDKEHGLSFSGAFDSEYTRVQYGKLLIEFPYQIGKLKKNDWLKTFDIIVDNNPVILDTGVKSVPDIKASTSTRSSRLVDKLLPGTITNTPTRIPTANRIIRIQLKK